MVADPTSPTGWRVEDSPLMEALPRSVANKIKKFSRGFIDWGDEQAAIARSFEAPPPSALETEMARTLAAYKRSVNLIKNLRKTIRKNSAENPPRTSNRGTSVARTDGQASACSFNDKVLAAVTHRLASELGNPSRFASLAKSTLKKDSRDALLRCICAVHSGKTASVSQWFQTTPYDASPNCRDVSNGPCVGAGYGCMRSPFIPDKKALETCGAARVIAQSLCRDKPGGSK